MWTTAILVIGGLTLSSYYVRSVENGFDQRLHVHLKTIVARVADGTFQSADPGSFGEPRFEIPLSGWYWQITRIDRDPPEATTSKSLFEEQLPRLGASGADGQASVREGYAAGPEGRRLRIVERIIDLGQDGRYLISIGAASNEIDKDVANFNFALLVCFVLLGLGLVITTGFQVKFGLKPLARIRAQLVEIRNGDRARLDGAFPREIAPLAGELNALIDSNRQIVERARTHVGNLAHGLKTPLSVIANEANAGDGAFAEKVREQAVLMRRQIDHHLERARLSAGIAFAGESAEVKPVVEGLARAIEKIHRDRAIEVEISIAEPLRMRCERQDLEEMVGNLVDNAFKWANAKVAITVEASPEATKAQPSARLTVDDDGPGLTDAQFSEVMARGRRLDETKPGSGLGLAIVNELAAMYGGSVELRRSAMGGLRCELTLPTV
ncbi:sensor histidine kinase [Chenggangzhangella methanolivorans]|uniref:histidine kinase n=2 Tax=Chenggangzhangella methanolivorans TaxID=1437009 RepID=A0A9E6RE15_9HYPH|nr:HAMP domain-containing sensor histidine kinase [Chenggangzhangella methanolivorans]QZO02250.1 HAMP domain-containing histidine kinase [Chenggangzhangella methanolivorans]